MDLAKGVLVADAVSAASLTSSFSRSLTAGTMGWVRGVATLGKLAYRGLPNLRDAFYMAKGGFRVVPRGTYASGLSRLIVYGSQQSKGELGFYTHLTHAGAAYDDLARWASPSAAGEFARGVGTKGFWVANIGAAVLVNAIDYGWGSKADVGIGSTEFYAAVTVDIAFGLASAGTGALFAAVLLWWVPGAQPAAVLIAFVIGQASFTGVSWGLGWREPAVRRVAWVYERFSEEALSAGHRGTGFPSPLLR